LQTSKIRNLIQRTPDNLKDLVNGIVSNILFGNQFYVRPEQVLAGRVGCENQAAIPPVVNVINQIMLDLARIFLHIEMPQKVDPVPVLFENIEKTLTQINSLYFPDSENNNSSCSYIHAIFS
jgi:hypothetical protein